MVRGQNVGRFDAYELLRQFRARGIRTALDTCGACVWAQMQPLLPYHKLGGGKYEAIGKRWEMPPCRRTGRIWRAAACAACGEATANRTQNV